MDDTLANISHNNNTSNNPLPTDIEQLVTTLVNEKFHRVQDTHDERKSQLQETCSSIMKEMEQQHNVLNTTMSNVMNQIDTLETQIPNLIQDSIQTTNNLVDIQRKIEFFTDTHSPPTTNDLNDFL